MNEIIIKFDDQGNPQVSVNGIKGRSCKEATEAIEKALGRTTEDRTTDEYNMAETGVSHVQR